VPRLNVVHCTLCGPCWASLWCDVQMFHVGRCPHMLTSVLLIWLQGISDGLAVQLWRPSL
jgi:hypothetical protein